MMTEPERNYGQGTLGTEATLQKTRRGLWARIRYLFDNALSSKKRFVGVIFITMIVLAIVMTGVQAFLAAITWLNQAAGEHPTYFDQFWAAFSKILSLGGESTWAERIIGVLYWAIAIAVTGTVIGFITSLIQRTMAQLSKGTSAIIESEHTLILGWSPRVFPILDELALAQESKRKPIVVVFADRDRQTMDDEIRTHTSRLFGKGKSKLRVVTRRGNLANPTEVARSNPAEANAIIVLDDTGNDANILTTVLAIRANTGDSHPPIIAEIDDAHVAETLRTATNGAVRSVRSHDIIARVTAQASRQPGLAAVVLDLLDFDGDELYFADATVLLGATYEQALQSCAESTVIGVMKTDGACLLNPAASTVIAQGDKLIVIAADDSTVRVELPAAMPDVPRVSQTTKPSVAKHILVIGWSSMGRSVMNYLSEYLPTGSTMHIVARTKFVDPDELAHLKFGEVKVSHAAISGDVDEVIEAAERRKYDEIIVLGYRNALSRSEADAQTLLTMMQMNHMFQDDSNTVQQTRIVAEILDSTLLPLARVAAADDLVVSDVLGALLISQLAENPLMAPVLEDLLDAEGAAIHMRPAENLAETGTTVSFAQLVAAGSARGESVIGYRVAARSRETSSGVVLNPAKARDFMIHPDDAVIVIA
jgi:Trk K+ transport system NAD-binding subunit